MRDFVADTEHFPFWDDLCRYDKIMVENYPVTEEEWDAPREIEVVVSDWTRLLDEREFDSDEMDY